MAHFRQPAFKHMKVLPNTKRPAYENFTVPENPPVKGLSELEEDAAPSDAEHERHEPKPTLGRKPRSLKDTLSEATESAKDTTESYARPTESRMQERGNESWIDDIVKQDVLEESLERN